MNSNLPAARRWLEHLTEDVDKGNLTQSRREEILSQLKFMGRDVNIVKALLGVAGFKVLGHYAFGDYPRSTSREASRCIANAMLLLPATREIFAELEYLPKAAEAYKLQDSLDEFLFARILFLMTYTKSIDLVDLIEKHGLASSTVAHIKRHAETAPLVAQTDVDAVTAIVETAKLLFNVINAVPQLSARFDPAIPYLLTMIVRTPLPAEPLKGGHQYAVNALANLEFRDRATGGPYPDINSQLSPALDKLLGGLDRGLKGCMEAELDTLAIPMLTVLRKINEAASEGIRDKMKAELLPKDTERDLPLGQSSTMASRLLKLTTAAGLVNLPEVVSAFLFELSDKDANTFVKNVGYGYAAGYLMSHKIPIPESAKGTNGRLEVPVNPVTGQRLDKEAAVKMPEMTQEEKEREAERLYVLFERLNATGVVNVKNPVHQAAEEGRFEELNDSDSDRG